MILGKRPQATDKAILFSVVRGDFEWANIFTPKDESFYKGSSHVKFNTYAWLSLLYAWVNKHSLKLPSTNKVLDLSIHNFCLVCQIPGEIYS